eukprot:CAMPEP_0206615446 /NCGR_PEP_ID=MMETSP0325_2-20121206/58201_1 /ASSEMBLY_ACC=CAM_ASM_000347 /TAXON_ID=2866 /ORGANISM="Crypthecodinium cohnii, Strain Seligo" /LENGTH=91 /DNA_ID=CAMNT_0054136553 /DNA_START=104 /DNA_END=379 /DNA_ORIENTATION=-
MAPPTRPPKAAAKAAPSTSLAPCIVASETTPRLATTGAADLAPTAAMRANRPKEAMAVMFGADGESAPGNFWVRALCVRSRGSFSQTLFGG